MFGKLGWLLLAQRDGRKYKIDAYAQDLEHLIAAIEEKAAHVHDADGKADLMVMHFNAKTLQKHLGDSGLTSGPTSRGSRK